MESTIAAISTAMSPSGIGIVRISGPDCMEILSRIYRSKRGKKNIKEARDHTIHYGFIFDGDECVDEVLVMIMKSPRTYTGEDTVEIDCHGGVYAVKRVLDTVLKNGASLAGPGEFTKRAFLNGRLDLSQAEAVMDVIQSQNEAALKNSMNQLKGSVRKVIEELREEILYHVAFIESALDDPEHVSLEGYPEKLKIDVDKEMKKIKGLLDTCSDGKIIREGIRTVILGKPNAGKSTLLNVLLGENRAIVTEVPGTTRDTLEESLSLKGLSLRIVDTAGIRDTDDVVEKIGVEKARQMAAQADLILYVADSSTALDENDREILSIIKDRKAVVLYNKTDLPSVLDLEELKSLTNQPVIPISAREERGIDLLEETIRDLFFHGSISFQEGVYITSARHEQALSQAYESLQMVRKSIEEGMPEDFFTIDLMSAYESLGHIIGEAVGEDLIDEIFSRFCVGK